MHFCHLTLPSTLNANEMSISMLEAKSSSLLAISWRIHIISSSGQARFSEVSLPS